MQSHVSRHAVPEALAPRLAAAACGAACTTALVTEAYGARHVPKLVQQLAERGEQLAPAELMLCVRLLNQALPTQESKARAIQAGAVPALLAWLGASESPPELRQLCAQALSSICQLTSGRAAFTAAGGIAVLMSALACTAGDAAVAAVKVLAGSVDGRAALRASPVRITAMLLELLDAPSTSTAAAADAADCIAGMCGAEEGLMDALACQAPRCLVQLAGRVLQQEAAARHGGGSTQQPLALLRAVGGALLAIAHDPLGKGELRKAGGIPVLAAMLGVPDDGVQAGAAACLAALSVEPDSKLAVMTSAGEQLLAASRRDAGGGDDGTRAATAVAARAALLVAAEDPDARRKLELLVSPADSLLGQLGDVTPDFQYVVWRNEQLAADESSGSSG